MNITRVSVTYGELRSEGFSNKRNEITLEAVVEPGETARRVKERLLELAINEVRKAFGDIPNESEMDRELPF